MPGMYVVTSIAIGQPRARHFAQRRVRLLGRLRVHANAHAALFRTALQRRTLRLHPNLLASVSNQLRKRRHVSPSIQHALRAALAPARTGAQKRHREIARTERSVAIPADRQVSPQTDPDRHFPYGWSKVERLTRLCGAGAPFRPHSWSHSIVLCSGTGNLPLQQGASPDRRRSIEETNSYVKRQLVETHPILWPPNCLVPELPCATMLHQASNCIIFIHLARPKSCHPEAVHSEGSAFFSTTAPLRNLPLLPPT